MTEQNMNYRTPCRKPIGSYLPWKLFISPTFFFFYQGQHDISEGLNAVVTKPRISLSARSNASGSAVLPYRKEIVIIMGRDRAIKSSKIVIGLSRDGMMWASKHNSIYTCTCMEYPIYQGKDTFWVQFSFNDCLSLYFKVYINIFSPKFYLHLIKTKWRTWAQLLCWPDLCFLGVMGCIVWVYLIISFNNWQTQLIVRMRRGRGRNLFRHLFTIYRRPSKINVTQRNTVQSKSTKGS